MPPSVSSRVVAVPVPPTAGLDPVLADAMLDDVVDLVAATPQVSGAILASPGQRGRAERVAWPGTTVIDLAAAPTVAELLGAVAGADQVAVLASDVPQLPGLIIGKLFRAIAGQRGPSIAASPASDGGLVAVAARLPVAGWLEQLTVGLDDLDAWAALTGAAPRGSLAVVPGWHRIRSDADLAGFDPGFDGGDATRSALGV